MRETLARQLVAHAPRVVWRGAALPALVAGGSAVRLMATFVSEKPTASRTNVRGELRRLEREADMFPKDDARQVALQQALTQVNPSAAIKRTRYVYQSIGSTRQVALLQALTHANPSAAMKRVEQMEALAQPNPSAAMKRVEQMERRIPEPVLTEYIKAPPPT
ncbi:hypothetical protein T484DRAFT_1821005 [Baffinella frigidus]|nr:hypothetical protein T484DRAFT_1821005 [Cryptophyta sp. CCMP2293]